MTGVIHSEETEALSEEGMHCPRRIKQSFLGYTVTSFLWDVFVTMLYERCVRNESSGNKQCFPPYEYLSYDLFIHPDLD